MLWTHTFQSAEGLCVQAFRFRHAVYDFAFAFCSSMCKASRSGSGEKNNTPSATPASVRLLLTRPPWLKAFCFQNHFRKGWEYVQIQQSSLFLLRFSYISQVDVPWIFSSLWFTFRILKNLIWTILPAGMFSGGLCLQRLGAGPGFPARGWGWVVAVKPLDHWSVMEALALRLCKEEFPQRWKVVNWVKNLLRGKREQYLWIDTRADSEGEPLSRVRMAVLNHLFRTFLLGFLWPIVLICLVHSHI